MDMTWALLIDPHDQQQPRPRSWVPSGLSLDRGTLAPSVRALIFQGHSKINTRDPLEGSGDRGAQPGLAVMGQQSISSLV